MSLRKEVIARLLLSKFLLRKVSSHAVAEPDRYFVASQLMTSHDAAELALAAVADHRGKSPPKSKSFLMDYFASLKELHPEREVCGKEYFRQLNEARIGVKHIGNFPDPTQWARAGERVYEYVSEWCDQYLGVSFYDLDESALLTSSEVKKRFDAARQAMHEGKFEQVMIRVAYALDTLFRENRALSGLEVGIVKGEDAIRLSGFGVHANDFLTLQEFLPEIRRDTPGDPAYRWQQQGFGHPGNWRKDNAEFCLRAFLDMALKIQSASWVPRALPFSVLYEYKVTAVRDGVEVWDYVWASQLLGAVFGEDEIKGRTVLRALSKGESFRAQLITLMNFGKDSPPSRFEECSDVLKVICVQSRTPASLVGYVDPCDVTITCVPADDPFVKERFPELPEVPLEGIPAGGPQPSSA